MSERLQSREVLVADGAMGTMLFERGLTPGECPERVNLERPEILEEIAHLYLDAGSDIVLTNTFGGSPLKLAQYGLDDRTEDINAAAVRAVRKAVGDRAYVAASCGPCGRLLMPYGDVEPEEVAAGFERQVRALVAAGIDMLCVETMTDLAEAKLAVRAAKSVAPSLPVTATMTFDPTPRGFFTIMGNSIAQAAEGLAEAGADIIGSNCGNGIEKMVEIAAEFRKCTSLPLIIQSNAGLPEMRDGRPTYPETPEFFARGCRRLLDIGVSIVGGCCGTTPEHIAA
ncbi:MAG TPA: homocysteine S-methyltransferase family protein, partial [Acidobacteriota bacterium]|nr:homocysteine S-methyltransferase family protein [Acidobacteriota bacterium]